MSRAFAVQDENQESVPTQFIAEYIWLGGLDTYHDFRSKCKTLTIPNDSPISLYPMWNFDGSSTGQATGEDTEILIQPVVVFDHPFIPNGKAVLCECFNPDGSPTKCNTRHVASQIFLAHKDLVPWYGLEQEYVINHHNGRPIGWPEAGYPAPQGPYYCGTGSHVVGRTVAEEHYQLCLKVGVRLSGINAEVMPGQWEFQVGPCEGIEAGDHLVMARWIFQRIAEKYNYQISYQGKPVAGDWNGSGCHCNYSTLEMRQEGGFEKIKEAVNRMSKTVLLDVPFYGLDNNARLTGKHETSKLSEFTWGVGTRHTSVRIPNETQKNNRGYLEDRRPAASIDPYLVTIRIFVSSNGLSEVLDASVLVPMQSWMKKL